MVNISTTYNPEARRPRRHGAQRPPRHAAAGRDDEQDGGGMDDFLYRFFGNPFGGGGATPRCRSAAGRRSVPAW